MSATITIQLSPSAIALSDKFRNAPREFPQAIKRGMTRALQIVAGRIQEKRLTGHGPFPVAEHRLGERSGQLKLRTRATEATVVSEGDIATVSGTVGSSVVYAAVHEFGFEGDVTVKAHERRLFRRTSTRGKPLKKPKLKGSTQVRSFTRHMSIPERAPFRTGIRENVPYISGEIEKEMLTSLKP
jgi:phage gpG-like protein